MNAFPVHFHYLRLLRIIDRFFAYKEIYSSTSSALENEVGIRQCRPKCRPINVLGRQRFADNNLAKESTACSDYEI